MVRALLRAPSERDFATAAQCNKLCTDNQGWTPFCYSLYKECIPCALELLKGSDEEAVEQLRVLGRLLSEEGKITTAQDNHHNSNHHNHRDSNRDHDMHEGDTPHDDTRQQLRSAISSLATVPEFYHFVNACVRRVSVAQAMAAAGGRGSSGRTAMTMTHSDTHIFDLLRVIHLLHPLYLTLSRPVSTIYVDRQSTIVTLTHSI